MGSRVSLVSQDAGFVQKCRGVFAQGALDFEVLCGAGVAPLAAQAEQMGVVVVDVAGSGPEEGLEFVRGMRCREHLRKIPIIAVIGQPDRGLVLALHQVGVRDILSKDSTPEVLLERIRKFCKADERSLPAQQPRSVPESPAHGFPQWSDPATTTFKKHVQREVSKRLEMLPSLPIVIMEIMQLVEDEHSSASDFEEQISHDQALAARLLRIANSSFFAQSRQVKSIRDAIVILGLRTLKSLALAASTSKILDRPAEGYGYKAGGLWKHSIACAVGSRLAARKFGHRDSRAEEFFVHGLLHDIGKLLLNAFVVDKTAEFRQAIQEQNLPLLEAERLILGTDHTEVGVRIAESWNLPAEVTTTIKCHHQPWSAGPSREQVALIHAVNYLCHTLKIGMFPDTFIRDEVDTETMRRMGLSDVFFKELSEDLSLQLKEMEKLFAMIGPA